MPLHMTGLVSRRQLDHPGDKPPVAPSTLNYEHVLKYNPNHDSKNGRFTSGGGGRRGGTQGPPTTGAFGQPLKGKPKPKYSETGRFDKPGGGYSSADVARGSSGWATRPQDSGYSPTQRTLDYRPARDAAPAQRQTLEYRHPIGTQYCSDQTLIPTGEKGVVPKGKGVGIMSNDPIGTIYGSSQTLVPSGDGNYIDKDTGQVYRSESAGPTKEQLASDAAKQAAYAAAFGKKKRKK